MGRASNNSGGLPRATGGGIGRVRTSGEDIAPAPTTGQKAIHVDFESNRPSGMERQNPDNVSIAQAKKSERDVFVKENSGFGQHSILLGGRESRSHVNITHLH